MGAAEQWQGLEDEHPGGTLAQRGEELLRGPRAESSARELQEEKKIKFKSEVSEIISGAYEKIARRDEEHNKKEVLEA